MPASATKQVPQDACTIEAVWDELSFEDSIRLESAAIIRGSDKRVKIKLSAARAFNEDERSAIDICKRMSEVAKDEDQRQAAFRTAKMIHEKVIDAGYILSAVAEGADPKFAEEMKKQDDELRVILRRASDEALTKMQSDSKLRTRSKHLVQEERYARTIARRQGDKVRAAPAASTPRTSTVTDDAALPPSAPLPISATPAEQAAAEWESNFGDCRASFIDERTYAAYRKVELQGQVRMSRRDSTTAETSPRSRSADPTGPTVDRPQAATPPAGNSVGMTREQAKAQAKAEWDAHASVRTGFVEAGYIGFRTAELMGQVKSTGRRDVSPVTSPARGTATHRRNAMSADDAKVAAGQEWDTGNVAGGKRAWFSRDVFIQARALQLRGLA